MNREFVLKFRSVNRDIFEAVRRGVKKVETRANTDKYKNIKLGDAIIFVCGKSKFRKIIKGAERFRTIGAILKKYRPQEINPKIKTEKEIRAMWCSFPGYKEKIKKYGLIAFKL